MPSFYRTAAGGEIDLVLEIAGHGRWAFDIKRSRSAKPEKGFCLALQDLKPDRQFLVNSGSERHPMTEGVEAIGLAEMAAVLGNL